jgi:hypothetical protein
VLLLARRPFLSGTGYTTTVSKYPTPWIRRNRVAFPWPFPLDIARFWWFYR